jgi:hypothetical protein
MSHSYSNLLAESEQRSIFDMRFELDSEAVFAMVDAVNALQVEVAKYIDLEGDFSVGFCKKMLYSAQTLTELISKYGLDAFKTKAEYRETLTSLRLPWGIYTRELLNRGKPT